LVEVTPWLESVLAGLKEWQTVAVAVPSLIVAWLAATAALRQFRASNTMSAVGAAEMLRDRISDREREMAAAEELEREIRGLEENLKRVKQWNQQSAAGLSVVVDTHVFRFLNALRLIRQRKDFASSDAVERYLKASDEIVAKCRILHLVLDHIGKGHDLGPLRSRGQTDPSQAADDIKERISEWAKCSFDLRSMLNDEIVAARRSINLAEEQAMSALRRR
jgi:hypothetical protein